jgi:hypothetical protein
MSYLNVNQISTAAGLPSHTIGANTINFGTQSIGASSASTMKNRIINGDMRINQRGFSGTPTNGAYTLDRWYTGVAQASKLTISQNAGSVTPPAGYTNYLGITSSSAYSVTSTDYFYIEQIIEGLNVADLAWGTSSAKTVTVSAQVYSSLTGTFGGVIQNGAGNRSYPFTYTISSVNTWTPISVTIPGDTTGTWATDNTGGMFVLFSLGSGSTYSGTAGSWSGGTYFGTTGATSIVGTNGATFYITGVQLEVGSSATGFEYRQYGTELALCQRYFQKESSRPIGKAIVSNQSSAIQLPVTMRVAPTVTGASFSSPNGGAIGTCTIEDTGTGAFAYVNSSANGSINYNYLISYSAGSEL